MSTILITGASRGIGRATALQFAAPGNTLILVCKSNIDRLNELAEELRARGAIVLPVQADISDSAEVSCLFDTIESRGLSVDLLINNAGISYTGLLQDMTDTEWHTILDTNLSSIFYCCRAVIPMMLKNGQGKIINISSIWGEYGASCEVAYSATKGAVNSFTKALAKELAPSNIQVNAVSFGFID
ncbi:MAG: SDR family NAD(P)-dependent oxidoreductase, partial [Lachnospiraceae bacterium]|nr:SDR family NAD(P)-dependent oxidoreductase [Lachnospiraceae bacterium]